MSDNGVTLRSESHTLICHPVDLNRTAKLHSEDFMQCIFFSEQTFANLMFVITEGSRN